MKLELILERLRLEAADHERQYQLEKEGCKMKRLNVSVLRPHDNENTCSS
jgi:hypothetical protein